MLHSTQDTVHEQQACHMVLFASAQGLASMHTILTRPKTQASWLTQLQRDDTSLPFSFGVWGVTTAHPFSKLICSCWWNEQFCCCYSASAASHRDKEKIGDNLTETSNKPWRLGVGERVALGTISEVCFLFKRNSRPKYTKGYCIITNLTILAVTWREKERERVQVILPFHTFLECSADEQSISNYVAVVYF